MTKEIKEDRGKKYRIIKHIECSDYSIAFAESVQDLQENVRNQMESGWLPLGQPFVFGKNLCQAMVLRD